MLTTLPDGRYKSFEDEFFEAFPDASGKLMFGLCKLHEVWEKSPTWGDFQPWGHNVFQLMSFEQLQWCETRTHHNTPWGTVCREVLFERLMLEKKQV